MGENRLLRNDEVVYSLEYLTTILQIEISGSGIIADKAILVTMINKLISAHSRILKPYL